MGLASGLMCDFVPAFGEKKYGRPRKSYTGSRFHKARLVQIVRAVSTKCWKEKGLPFDLCEIPLRKLVRILKKNPAPRWRYGQPHQTVSSFAQEWKYLSLDYIKKNPHYLHPASIMPPWDFRKFAISRPRNGAVYPRDARLGCVPQARIYGAPIPKSYS